MSTLLPVISSQNIAPGYVKACNIEEYTHVIDTGRNNSLVINFATGRYVYCTKEHVHAAKVVVEIGAGADSAAPLMDVVSNLYDASPVGRKQHTSIVVLPTYGCNLGCSYCYEGKLTLQTHYWPIDECRAFGMSALRFLDSRGVLPSDASLHVLGGEPVRIEYLDNLCALVESVSSHGLHDVRIVTNGVDLAQCASTLHNSGAKAVMVSIDGPRDIHDSRRPFKRSAQSSFDHSIAGVLKAVEIGLYVTVRVNFDDRNIHAISQLGHLFQNLGLFAKENFNAYVYPVTTDFRTKRKFASEAELAAMFAEEVREHPILRSFQWEFHGLEVLYAARERRPIEPKLRYCGATADQYVVDVSKGVFPCWFGTGKNGFQVGTLDEENGDIIVDELLDRRWRSRSPLTLEPCKSCKWATICGGGCSFKSHQKTGTFLNPNCADFQNILAVFAPLLFADV